jgi:hypothetical protein
MRAELHRFISNAPDIGGERISAGYPDECMDFTTFAGSLAALVTDGEWIVQPFTQKRTAVIVDFASETEAEAEDSLQRGWNGAWEFPIGCINTVRSRIETNEQNARIERHLSLIATGDTMREFYWGVVEKLLDAHSCKDPNCRVCQGRFKRDLALAIVIFADLGFSTIYLFSRWQPSVRLREVLRKEQIEIQWNPLSAIPSADLDANRYYSIWDGTQKQYEDFIQRFWAPSWQRPSDRLQGAVELVGRSNKRPGTLAIPLPIAKPGWRSVSSMHFSGVYATRSTDFTQADEAAFVKEANRLCLTLLRKVREMTTDPADFTWLLVPAKIDSIVSELGLNRSATSWAVNVRAAFDPDDEAAQSLWKAWAPRLYAALCFAMPGKSPESPPALEGNPDDIVTLAHD